MTQLQPLQQQNTKLVRENNQVGELGYLVCILTSCFLSCTLKSSRLAKTSTDPSEQRVERPQSQQSSWRHCGFHCKRLSAKQRSWRALFKSSKYAPIHSLVLAARGRLGSHVHACRVAN